MKVIVNKVLSPLGLDLNQINGFLDFIIGFILVIMPWFYVTEGNIRSLAIVMIIGSALILYSIFTDYKQGIVRLLARKIHEALDLTLGITFMALFPVKYTMTGLLLSFSGIIIFLGIYLF